MKVVIEKSIEMLNLDEKTGKVLRLMGEGYETETLKMSQFIKILDIMEFNDWTKFDEVLDDIVELEANTNKVKSVSDKPKKTPVKKSKEPEVKAPEKKLVAKGAKMTVAINVKTKKKRADINEEFLEKLKAYIDSVDKYTISDIAKKFNISYSTARRQTMHIDPDREKLIDRSNHQHVKKFIDYISLNNDQQDRQNKLNGYIEQFTAEQSMSKTSLMDPIYDTLKNNYGIVFEQSAKDMMYENNLTPLSDYPYPTKNDIIVYYGDIFNIAQSLMLDLYGQG